MIGAHFSIDVGLLSSLRLDTPQNGQPGEHQKARFQLLLALALWKVAAFLELLRIELSLRTECKLRLKGNPKFKTEGQTSAGGDFPYQGIAQASCAGDNGLISQAHLQRDRHPLVLKFSA